jgi:polyhydroxybutyrate depolymerase
MFDREVRMPGKRWRTVRALAAAAAITMTVSCGSTDTPGPSPSTPVVLPTSGTTTLDIGGRPVNVHVPDSYDPDRGAPLVILLHGYSSHAQEQESYLRLTPESDRRGFVYAYPDGTVDSRGDRFWNATDACCDFFGAKPDDSKHLSDLITALKATYRIDRVFLFGHSNGGFMSFRMACDHAGQLTGIASLNGATWNDATQCKPSRPVSVLAVHSSTDETISFEGGINGRNAYPSAATTVQQWRDFNKCTGTGRDDPDLDLVSDLPGTDTSVRTYQGCSGNATVQAWTIKNGKHVPAFGPAFAPAVIDFLLAQTGSAT